MMKSADFNTVLAEALKKQKIITNADRIRSMTDEELAETFDLLTRMKPDTKDDKQNWVEWLREEVDE